MKLVFLIVNSLLPSGKAIAGRTYSEPRSVLVASPDNDFRAWHRPLEMTN